MTCSAQDAPRCRQPYSPYPLLRHSARAAREAHEAMEAAQRRGEPVPDPDTRFDSNCITPGTREGGVGACRPLAMPRLWA